MFATMDLPDSLRTSPLLVGLTDEELTGLLGIAESRAWADGDLIVQEGAASDCLFVIEQGAVSVQRQVDGGVVELARLDEPGAFFGEMSLIDILPRSADIRAAGEARILALPKQQLTSFFTQSPRVQMTMILNISRNLSLRLRQADERILALSRG